MPESQITTFDLIRHGEPVGGRKYRGHTDDPLSENGWAQMRQAVHGHCPWQVIISSPLSRCVEFARELSARHGLPLEIEARLMELGFGAWEGRTPAELTASDPGVLRRFRRDPIAYAPPGAEPLATFRRRILGFWNDVLAHHGGQHVLVVAHAGVIRMFVAHVLETPLRHLFRLQVPNACITRIRVEKNGAHELPELLFHAGRL